MKSPSSFIIHPIAPVFDQHSEILILGSFPSVRSRKEGFFYGHPGNHFWKVISSVFTGDEPKTTEEKKEFLLRNHIALWDVISSCDIAGSSDSSIKNVTPNDLRIILNAADIKAIFTNGKTAWKFHNKLIRPSIGTDAICLPSTSPANAAWNTDRLISEWSSLIFNSAFQQTPIPVQGILTAP